MSILSRLLKRKENNSAKLAKERLQIIVSHERADRNSDPDYLPLLQKELLEVIAKYVKVDKDQIKVELERDSKRSILELNVTLPEREPV